MRTNEPDPHPSNAPAPSEAESAAPNSENEPVLPHATEKTPDDEKPPLYISGFGVMGQNVPDVTTGSTPVTRHDD